MTGTQQPGNDASEGYELGTVDETASFSFGAMTVPSRLGDGKRGRRVINAGTSELPRELTLNPGGTDETRMRTAGSPHQGSSATWPIGPARSATSPTMTPTALVT